MNSNGNRIAIDTSQLLPSRLRIAVLFDPLLAQQANIIKGVNNYLLKEDIEADLIYGNELSLDRNDVDDVWFDGVIADYSDPLQVDIFERSNLPVVGILEQSEINDNKFNALTVGVNSSACVEMAVDCFISSGINNIACYYVVGDDTRESYNASRLQAFNSLDKRLGVNTYHYQGELTNLCAWKLENQKLLNWITLLPKPCGIIAINESRAKAVLDACIGLGYLASGETSIITMTDNNTEDFISRYKITRIKTPLSDVGSLACEILSKKIGNERITTNKTLLSPSEIEFGDTTQSNVDLDPVVIQVNAYIRNNFMRGVKVQQVVDSTGFSRTLVEKRYKDKMGCSIHKVLHDAKLDHAKYLLMTTDLSVSDVAKLSGYSTEEYLYRVFKLEVKMTPVDFRGKNKA